MDMFANGFNFELFLDMLRRHIWIATVLFCVNFYRWRKPLIISPEYLYRKSRNWD